MIQIIAFTIGAAGLLWLSSARFFAVCGCGNFHRCRCSDYLPAVAVPPWSVVAASLSWYGLAVVGVGSWLGCRCGRVWPLPSVRCAPLVRGCDVVAVAGVPGMDPPARLLPRCGLVAAGWW